MAVLPITIYGEPVLHQRAQEVEEITPEIRELIDNMYVTMDAAHGVGLAAPQVGVGLRIFTYDFSDTGKVPNRGVVINPVLQLLGKVSQESPDRVEEAEGCLSAPGLNFPLKRADHVRVQGFDAQGLPLDFEAHGWFARILQHEFDHLDGYLYVDKLNPRWSKQWKKAQKKLEWTIPGRTWLPGVDPDPFGHGEGDEETS